MTRARWLNERRRGLGASDVAKLIPGPDGRYAFGGPAAVAAAKWHGVKVAESPAMRWGHLLEPVVLAEFGRRAQLAVHHNDRFELHRRPEREREWAVATIDGWAGRDGRCAAGAPVEIKTTGVHGAGDWGLSGLRVVVGERHEGAVPYQYLAQVQWQLYVVDAAAAWLAVLIGGSDLRWYQVERSEAYIGALVDVAAGFWSLLERHDDAAVASLMDGSPAADELLALEHPEHAGAVDLPADADALIAEYVAGREASAAAEERRKRAGQRLRAMLGDAKSGRAPGGGLVTAARIETERVDLDSLKGGHPEIYSQMLRASSHVRLTVRGSR